MSAITYLIIGAIIYVGYHKLYQWLKATGKVRDCAWNLHNPVMITCLVSCFLLMLPVSAMVGRYVHAHASIDVAYVLVNSLVATLVAYFALTADQDKANPLSPP